MTDEIFEQAGYIKCKLILIIEREKITISAKSFKQEVEVIRRFTGWMNKTKNTFRAKFKLII